MNDEPRRPEIPAGTEPPPRPEPLIPEVIDRDDLNPGASGTDAWGEDQQPPFPWTLFDGGFQVRSINCGPGCVAFVLVACIVLALVLNLFI